MMLFPAVQWENISFSPIFYLLTSHGPKKGNNAPKIHIKCPDTVPLHVYTLSHKCHLIYPSRHNPVKDIVLKYYFGKTEKQHNKSYFLGNTCNSLTRKIWGYFFVLFTGIKIAENGNTQVEYFYLIMYTVTFQHW